jgi:hypothetical protein
VYRVRRAFALLFACALTLLLVAPPRPAAAATAPATPSFSLFDQPAAVGPTDPFPLRLRVRPAGATNLSVRVTLHRNIETRTGFEQTVAGEDLGREIDSAEISLAGAPTSKGVVTARFGMPDAYVARPQVLRPTRTGVYPLTVELLSGNDVVDHFVTWLVYLDGAGRKTRVAEPLSFVWVWSLVAPPARQADGVTPDTDVLADMLPGGRLERIASLLSRATDARVPLTLDVSPETLQSWLAFANERRQLEPGAAAARVAASDAENQLLPEPYVPIDVPAFERAGFGDELSQELIAGTDTLHDLTGVRVDDLHGAIAVDPANDAALGRLREFLFDRVLVREEQLPPRQTNLTPARPFTLATSNGGEFDAASTNPTVTAWLSGPQPAALRAQRFLAGLSLIALEQPNAPRGIVVATPRNWQPDLTAVAHVLRGLQVDPLVEPVTLNDYFANVPPETTDDGESALVRRLLPSRPNSYPITTLEYAQARKSLASFRGLVGDDDPSVRRGEQAMMIALSSALTPARAREELAVIDRAASSFLSQISVTQQRVTLTARRAEIPLAFSNQTSQPVRVRVRLDAPSGKVLFPEGAERSITLQPGNSTQRFVVVARATGTFAMTVTLTSDDGQLHIGAPTEITVRSTVFSGWGAMLTVGALVFLAGWWANHIWRSRRAVRRAATA